MIESSFESVYQTRHLITSLLFTDAGELGFNSQLVQNMLCCGINQISKNSDGTKNNLIRETTDVIQGPQINNRFYTDASFHLPDWRKIAQFHWRALQKLVFYRLC